MIQGEKKKKKVKSVSCCHQLTRTDGLRLSYLLDSKRIIALFHREEGQTEC